MNLREEFKWEAGAAYYGGERFPRLAALRCMARDRLRYLHCRIRGHRWESYADAENGSEDIFCERCGYHMHHQF